MKLKNILNWFKPKTKPLPKLKDKFLNPRAHFLSHEVKEAKEYLNYSDYEYNMDKCLWSKEIANFNLIRQANLIAHHNTNYIIFTTPFNNED